ncbi:uncharacterized protein A4U43_C01F19190 [Asparagus officinalis]|uniref:Reverse transcriptase Ty1/copia-type domain-containing protein n=1 Tax=Asparagus officinalis TaxID=4686 RepID=A0A5P1FV54_ASPOF|nr:uncharacterized protein A4U43_C01F19190 [Asparagus officinalis]
MTLEGDEMTVGYLKDIVDGEAQEQGHTQGSIVADRPRREIRWPARYNDVMVAYALSVKVVDDLVPSTFRDAEFSPDSIRLVVKGYAQLEGVDYNEVFSPIVKYSSIQILLALVAQLDLDLVQMDVKTAFLHGDLDEEIYMTQPMGYKAAGREELVCKLKKSLYGLKQSLRQWYKRFDSFMIGQGYTMSPYDPCVYMCKLQDGEHIYLLL